MTYHHELPLVNERICTINVPDVNRILRRWLRINRDVSEREYVGVGFTMLKEMLFEESDMEFKNAKVEIYDSQYRNTACIKTYDYDPDGWFRKNLRINGKKTVWYDPWHRFKKTLERAWDYLVHLLNPFLPKVPAVTRYNTVMICIQGALMVDNGL